jgi:hypothetical protein
MIAWRRVPWPLWVVALMMLSGAIQIELVVDGPVLVMILNPVLMLAWVYFLLRGVRWVWLLTIAIGVLGLAFDVVAGSVRLWVDTTSLIELVLLLLPITRRYFSPEQALVIS